MLQSWRALQLQLGQRQARGGAGRSIPGPPEVATAQLATARSGWPSARGLRPRAHRPPETRVCAFHSCAAEGNASLVAPGRRGAAARGRAWRARGRQPRPEVSAVEVCVGFLAAPPNEWEARVPSGSLRLPRADLPGSLTRERK